MKQEKISKGTNVRISNTAYLKIKKFCKERGFQIGAFCANAALQRMERLKHTSE
jgi:hypothetical protein